MKRLIVIAPDGRDVSDSIETRNGKANPFGWSIYDLVHTQDSGSTVTKIGVLYCGSVDSEGRAPGYQFIEHEMSEQEESEWKAAHK